MKHSMTVLKLSHQYHFQEMNISHQYYFEETKPVEINSQEK